MKEPPLNKGEKIIRCGPACISVGLYTASWRPVNLVLTNKRLLFCQPSFRIIFEAPLDKVTDLTIVKGRFVLGLKKEQLCLSMGTRRLYIVVNSPGEWKNELREAQMYSKIKSIP